MASHVSGPGGPDVRQAIAGDAQRVEPMRIAKRAERSGRNDHNKTMRASPRALRVEHCNGK